MDVKRNPEEVLGVRDGDPEKMIKRKAIPSILRPSDALSLFHPSCLFFFKLINDKVSNFILDLARIPLNE
jgi:hypothetical protein